MAIGDNKYPIVFERQAYAAPDALGDQVESWADVARAFAGRKWLSSSEAVEDGSRRASALAVRFTVNGPLRDVKETDRVRFVPTGQVFDITSLLVGDAETVIEGRLAVPRA